VMVKRVILVILVLLGVIVVCFFTGRVTEKFRILRAWLADDSPAISSRLGTTQLSSLSNAVLSAMVPRHRSSQDTAGGFYVCIYLNRSLSSTMPIPQIAQKRIIFVYYHWMPLEDTEVPDKAFRMIVGVKAGQETSREKKLAVNIIDGINTEQVVVTASPYDVALGVPPLLYSNHWHKHGPWFRLQGKEVRQTVAIESLIWFGMRHDWGTDGEVVGYTITPSPVAYRFRKDDQSRRSGFAAAFLPGAIPRRGAQCTIFFADGRRHSFRFDAKGQVVSGQKPLEGLFIQRMDIRKLLRSESGGISEGHIGEMITPLVNRCLTVIRLGVTQLKGCSKVYSLKRQLLSF